MDKSRFLADLAAQLTNIGPDWRSASGKRKEPRDSGECGTAKMAKQYREYLNSD